VTGPAARSQQPQPAEPTATDHAFVYQSLGQPEAPDTWTVNAACPADAPVPYTLTAKAETLLGEPANPTSPLPTGHACGMATQPPQARPGLPGQPLIYITEISVPPSDNGIQRLHSRMKEPEPEPEAGL